MATFKIAAAAALFLGQATASPQSQMFEKRQVGGEEPTVVIPGASSYNGLNLVPQMGWDNWNAFGCDVNESLLLTTAQDMIDYGLRDLGYNYIILDDCWSVGSKCYCIMPMLPTLIACQETRVATLWKTNTSSRAA